MGPIKLIEKECRRMTTLNLKAEDVPLETMLNAVHRLSVFGTSNSSSRFCTNLIIGVDSLAVWF